MNDVIADWFTTGINTIIQAAILVMVIGLMGTVYMFNSKASEEQAIQTEIQAFNEFNEYDFTHVYAADVVSTIIRYRSTLYVTVNSDKGTYTWDSNTPFNEFAVSFIESKIQNDVVYDSSLIKSPSGAIVGIDFTKHVAGCGR